MVKKKECTFQVIEGTVACGLAYPTKCDKSICPFYQAWKLLATLVFFESSNKRSFKVSI